MSASNPIKVMIVEDQPEIRKDVESLVQKWPDFKVVGTSATVAEALQLLQSIAPDLLLLDVFLSDGTGFDILEQIPEANLEVIFLTGYEDHAIRALRIGAKDYLLKPIDELELKDALYRSALGVSQSTKRPPVAKISNSFRRLAIASSDQLQFVEWKNVVYCQSDRGYTTFYLANNTKIVSSKYIKEFEDQLPEQEFLRVHQSYIVNMAFVSSYHKDGYLLLHTGEKIPVATRRKDMVIHLLTGR